MPKYNRQELEEIVKLSTTNTEVLQKLNLRCAGGNYKVLNFYFKKWKIDTSHFLTSTEIAKRNWDNNKFVKTPIEQMLKENSSFNRTNLKKRLYKEGLKKPICEMEGCGQGEIWLGKKLSLILDHINGIWNDNRIENLRIICPMCNATLPTHAGRNKKTIHRITQKKERKTKIIWPSIDLLIEMVESLGYVEVGKTLGVSDNAVRKRILTRNNIDKENR